MTKPIKSITTPIALEYNFTPGLAGSRFIAHLADGKLVGQRCVKCQKVFVSPRGSCAKCGAPTREEVEVADRGTIVSFSIVRVPSEGIDIELPFCCVSILLDRSDIPFYHVLGEVDVEDVRMGMRVEAVWVPPEELNATMESIRYFRPTGEEDADFDSYKEHQ